MDVLHITENDIVLAGDVHKNGATLALDGLTPFLVDRIKAGLVRGVKIGPAPKATVYDEPADAPVNQPAPALVPTMPVATATLLNGGNDEVLAGVATLSDVAVLRDLLDKEGKTKKRGPVLDALNARIAAVEKAG